MREPWLWVPILLGVGALLLLLHVQATALQRVTEEEEPTGEPDH